MLVWKKLLAEILAWQSNHWIWTNLILIIGTVSHQQHFNKMYTKSKLTLLKWLMIVFLRKEKKVMLYFKWSYHLPNLHCVYCLCITCKRRFINASVCMYVNIVCINHSFRHIVVPLPKQNFACSKLTFGVYKINIFSLSHLISLIGSTDSWSLLCSHFACLKLAFGLNKISLSKPQPTTLLTFDRINWINHQWYTAFLKTKRPVDSQHSSAEFRIIGSHVGCKCRCYSYGAWYGKFSLGQGATDLDAMLVFSCQDLQMKQFKKKPKN